MKNIQVIDSADNCEYAIFSADDAEFEIIFPDNADVEFIDDLVERCGEITISEILERIWSRPINKRDVRGIHGTLFYELQHKRRFYPTKKESEAIVGLTDVAPLKLIIERLNAFEKDAIDLNHLVSSLNGLQKALHDVDAQWRNAFLRQFNALEHLSADAIDKNLKEIPDELMTIIKSATREMRRLVDDIL